VRHPPSHVRPQRACMHLICLTLYLSADTYFTLFTVALSVQPPTASYPTHPDAHERPAQAPSGRSSLSPVYGHKTLRPPNRCLGCALRKNQSGEQQDRPVGHFAWPVPAHVPACAPLLHRGHDHEAIPERRKANAFQHHTHQILVQLQPCPCVVTMVAHQQVKKIALWANRARLIVL
jgi:hypothetical protein